MLKKISDVANILLSQGCHNLYSDKRAKTTEIYFDNNKINILATGNILIVDKNITVPYSEVKNRKFNISKYFS